MKRRVFSIFLLTIFLIMTSYHVQADSDLGYMKLERAIKKLADHYDKNIMIRDDLDQIVQLNLNNKSFAEALDQLLAGTGYQYIYQADYYLIDKFKKESAVYASSAETELYRPKCIPAQVLLKQVKANQVEMIYLADQDYILLRGLPKKISEIKEEIAKIDSPDNAFQIKYQLTVIDITELQLGRSELKQIELNPDSADVSEFISTGKLIEILGRGIIAQFKLLIEDTEELKQDIARPLIVTEIGETGSLILSKERINYNIENNVLEEEKFEVKLLPEKIDIKNNRAATKIEFAVQGSSKLNTSTWLEADKDTLLGVMNLEQSKTDRKRYSSSVEKAKRQFAVFIKAVPLLNLTANNSIVGNHSRIQNQIETAGLEKVLWPDNKKKISAWQNKLQLLVSDNKKVDLDIMINNKNNDYSLEFISRQSSDFMALGIDGFYLQDLKLGGRLLYTDQDFLLGAGFSDMIDFGSGISFGAGYYPLFYNFSEEEWNNNYFWTELEYRAEPIFINFRYANKFEAEPFRLLTGVNFISQSELLAGFAASSENISRYLLGFRFNF